MTTDDYSAWAANMSDEDRAYREALRLRPRSGGDDDAQAEYDSNPELQALLHKAMTSPTVRRERRTPRQS